MHLTGTLLAWPLRTLALSAIGLLAMSGAARAEDCNNNGIQDECDLSCGAPGSACDVAGCGQGTDCDADGQLDACEAGAVVTLTTPELSPIGWDHQQHYRFIGPPPASGPVTIQVKARGQFGNNNPNCQNQYLNVYLGGRFVGEFFSENGETCPAVPQVNAMTRTAEMYNAAIANGELQVDMVPSTTVHAYTCEYTYHTHEFVQATITYHTLSDCNGNGVPDSCDIRDGTSADCNGNGIPDECEYDCDGNGVPDACDIAHGTSTDCDGNGIPDECEMATGKDCNGNGILDRCDITAGTSRDCNNNGVPDECDLSALPLHFVQANRYLVGDPVTFPIPGMFQLMATGDFNEDGRTDLAVTGFQTSTLSIRAGDGNGGFAQLDAKGSESAGASALLAGDFNGDGHLDLAVGTIDLVRVRLYLGNGAGHFTFAKEDCVGTPIFFAAGDFNEDGLLDLVSMADTEEKMAIFFGSRTTFEAPTIFYTPPRGGAWRSPISTGTDTWTSPSDWTPTGP